MNPPNLFDYATSELSQDAFICWLLAWAAPHCASLNSVLHECGKGLLLDFQAGAADQGSEKGSGIDWSRAKNRGSKAGSLIGD